MVADRMPTPDKAIPNQLGWLSVPCAIPSFWRLINKCSRSLAMTSVSSVSFILLTAYGGRWTVDGGAEIGHPNGAVFGLINGFCHHGWQSILFAQEFDLCFSGA